MFVHVLNLKGGIPMVLAFILAMLVSYWLTPFVIRLAYKIGAIDVPKDNRRVHKKPIPRLGGLAIYAGFVVGTFFVVPLTKEMIGILIGSAGIVCMGAVDDTIGLNAKTKLFIQICCALIVTLFGVRIDFVRNPFSSIQSFFYLKMFSIPVTVFWIVGITNTVNLIDGLDGLAAGVSSIAALTMAFVAFMNGEYVHTAIVLALAGGAVGFLPFNFNPAKIFMGDVGSLFLGFILSIIAVEATVKSAAALAVVVPILALGIPIFDTTFAIIRRSIAGKPIMQADKGHLHHRFLDIGLSQRQTVLVLYFISLVLGISAVLISKATVHTAVTVLSLDALIIVYGVFRLKMLSQEKGGDGR